MRHLGAWLPFASIVSLWIAGPVILLHATGLKKIYLWYLAQLAFIGWPLLLVITLIPYMAWKKRWRSVPVLSALLSALMTGIFGLAWATMLLPIKYPAHLEEVGPAATVRLPLDGPVRVGWGGDDLETNYHVATPDQRWAYDLLIAPILSGSDQLKDYGCYGRPILAPANGMVSWARDGLPDHIPGEVSNDLENPTGNGVALKLDETGTFLVIAHMRPGSVHVKEGQRVLEGEPLGECGNSGNTSEPHVHIHHQRQDPAEAPHGFAEGLPLYFRNHGGKPMPLGGFEERNGKIVITGDVIEHQP